MRTEYEIIGVDSIARTGHIEWPREPGFTTIRDFVQPLIQSEGYNTAYIEHVRVWHNGEYASMFVDDMGALRKLPVNEAATRIYHADMLEHQDANADTSDWPKIHGPAVLFHRNVWA